MRETHSPEATGSPPSRTLSSGPPWATNTNTSRASTHQVRDGPMLQDWIMLGRQQERGEQAISPCTKVTLHPLPQDKEERSRGAMQGLQRD